MSFPDRTRYIASFFTYKNIETLTKKNQISRENMSGLYFWASDMVLVENVKPETIEAIIDHLIAEDNFDTLFTKITDVSPGSDHLYPARFFDLSN